MSRQFSLAYLTIPGIDPIHQIQIAREAGYDYVSLRTIPMGLEGEPQVHLEDDPALFRAVRQALKDCGMKLLDIELIAKTAHEFNPGRISLPTTGPPSRRGRSWGPPRC